MNSRKFDFRHKIKYSSVDTSLFRDSLTMSTNTQFSRPGSGTHDLVIKNMQGSRTKDMDTFSCPACLNMALCFSDLHAIKLARPSGAAISEAGRRNVVRVGLNA